MRLAITLPAGASHSVRRSVSRIGAQGQASDTAVPMKIFLLSRSEKAGGAERQIVVLAEGLAARGHDVALLLFYGDDSVPLRQTGVRRIQLGKRGRWDVLPFLTRLIRLLRAERPDILYAVLPVANALAALSRSLVPGMRVVLGVRSADMEPRHYDAMHRVAQWGQALLASRADLIIVNSAAGRRELLKDGFPASGIAHIANGIDGARFAADSVGRDRLRRDWGVAEPELLIGVVARLDPMKDHETFLIALATASRSVPTLRAAIVGDGDPPARERLQETARALGVADRIIWSGWRDDMAVVYSALDMLCLSSAFGEGFPNVVGEAMACSVPCIVTDVGDAATLVAESGVVVPARHPAALAQAIEAMARLGAEGRKTLGGAARQRIERQFPVGLLVETTEAALIAVVDGRMRHG